METGQLAASGTSTEEHIDGLRVEARIRPVDRMRRRREERGDRVECGVCGRACQSGL